MSHQYIAPMPPPAPRRRMHPAVIVLIVFGVLFIAAGAGCAALLATSAEKVAKNPGTVNAPAKVHAMGTAAADGDFTFTVRKMRKAARVGDRYIGEDAQGVFIVLTVSVFNHGHTAQMLDASDQKLIAGGATYDATPDVTGKAFLKNINPGNTVTATIAFDVPKGTKPTQVVLHDSPFSNGVRVTLK